MAIGQLNAVNGFMQGYGFVDNINRQDRQEERQKQAIASDQQFRQQSNDRADQQLNLQQTQATAANEYRESALGMRKSELDSSTAFRKSQLDTARRAENRAILAAEQAKLKTELGMIYNSGKVPDEAFEKRLIDAEMETSTRSFYMDENNRLAQEGLGNVLAAFDGGDLGYVNTKEGLGHINKAYHNQIVKGVGEWTSTIGTVVDKQIVGLEAGPDGTYVATVRSFNADGKYYDDKMTAGRSSDPNDPVALNDLGVAMDDMMGRYQMSQLAKNEQAQQEDTAAWRKAVGPVTEFTGKEVDDNGNVTLYSKTGATKDMGAIGKTVAGAADKFDYAETYRKYLGELVDNNDNLNPTDRMTVEQMKEDARLHTDNMQVKHNQQHGTAKAGAKTGGSGTGTSISPEYWEKVKAGNPHLTTPAQQEQLWRAFNMSKGHLNAPTLEGKSQSQAAPNGGAVRGSAVTELLTSATGDKVGGDQSGSEQSSSNQAEGVEMQSLAGRAIDMVAPSPKKYQKSALDALVPEGVQDYFSGFAGNAGAASAFHKKYGRWPTDAEAAAMKQPQAIARN